MRSFTLFLGQCVQREKTNIHYTVFRCICSNRERLGFDEELYIIFGTVCAAGETRHILLHICSNRDRQLDLIRRFRLLLGQCVQREKPNIFPCICSNRDRLGFDEELNIIFWTVCTAGEIRHNPLHMLQP